MLYLRRSCAASLLVLAAAGCATAPVDEERTSSERASERAAPTVSVSGFAAEASLALCPRQDVSNAPATDADGNVRGYRPTASVNGVELLVNPAPASCLSSAFGMRSGKLHKGLDFQSDPAGPVVAAGAGTVLEAGYRDDYGQYVLIDHGAGVHTRYAHLSTIANAGREGRSVATGTPLGRMGNTASYRIPIHLHYEVLTGDYDTPAASFGLEPIDLLKRM